MIIYAYIILEVIDMPVKTEDAYCRNFAANVRYLIALTGKQQKDVAADLGISPMAFNNYLIGRNLPKFQIMQSIAAYFHVNVEDLVKSFVGGEIMFNERLSAEEMKMLEAFRSASEGNRAAALHILVRGTRAAALGQASRSVSRTHAWHYSSLASTQKKIKKK